VHDPLGFELVRVRADATSMLLPDLWMPPNKSHVDACDRPALVSDPDAVARDLRAAGLEVDGPHWDTERWFGWLRLTLPDGRRMLMANTLEPDDWLEPPS